MPSSADVKKMWDKIIGKGKKEEEGQVDADGEMRPKRKKQDEYDRRVVL